VSGALTSECLGLHPTHIHRGLFATYLVSVEQSRARSEQNLHTHHNEYIRVRLHRGFAISGRRVHVDASYPKPRCLIPEAQMLASSTCHRMVIRMLCGTEAFLQSRAIRARCIEVGVQFGEFTAQLFARRRGLPPPEFLHNALVLVEQPRARRANNIGVFSTTHPPECVCTWCFQLTGVLTGRRSHPTPKHTRVFIAGNNQWVITMGPSASALIC
jgi:hypothetical protein